LLIVARARNTLGVITTGFLTGQANATTRYYSFACPNSAQASEDPTKMAMTKAGTINNMRIRVSACSLDVGQIIVTLRKNGVDTALQITFDFDEGFPYEAQDTDDVDFIIGDDLNVKVQTRARAPMTVSKPCFLGYYSHCSFAPVSTIILVVLSL